MVASYRLVAVCAAASERAVFSTLRCASFATVMFDSDADWLALSTALAYFAILDAPAGDASMRAAI